MSAVALKRLLPNKLRLYGAFVRIAFLNMLAYRLRYYTGIFTYLLFVSVHYSIWRAIFSANSTERINGFTLEEMVTYVVVGWISRSFYFSNSDEEIDELVRSGQIGIYLLRPVNFQLMLLVRAVGETLFRLLFFSVPIAVVVLSFYPIMLPPRIESFLLFCWSTAAGFFILAELNFLVGLLAFSFKSIDGVMRAKYYLVQLLSGLLLPLTFFPGWLRDAVEILPFKLIAYVPLQSYLGKVSGTNILTVVLNQLFWLTALALAGMYFWRRAFAKLTIQGG